MRLHTAKVPQIAAEMLDGLLQGSDIETDNPAEVKADIEAVLNQYIRDEQEISDRAKELIAARGLPPAELNRVKKLAADERKIKIGEDAIDYLLDQLVEMLMHSANVEEVSPTCVAPSCSPTSWLSSWRIGMVMPFFAASAGIASRVSFGFELTMKNTAPLAV